MTDNTAPVFFSTLDVSNASLDSHRASPSSWIMSRLRFWLSWKVWLAGPLIRALLRWRTPVVILAHILVFVGVYRLAYFVRFDGAVPREVFATTNSTVFWVVAVKLGVFLLFKVHRGWWRYATFADLVSLAESTTVAAITLAVIDQLQPSGPLIPRSVIFLDWAGTVLVVGLLRGGTRLLRERYYPMVTHRHTRPVLVVGANEASLALIRQFQNRPDLGYRVVGILDENWEMRGRILAGVPVLGSTSNLNRIASRYATRTLLVPTPAVSPPEVRKLVTACKLAGLKLEIVPGIDALLSGRVMVQPRDVNIDDLLARNPVRLDDEAVGRFLRNRVVLVTGAAGSIGSELCRQILKFRPTRLVLLDHSENGLFHVEHELRVLSADVEIHLCVASITDAIRLRTVFDSYRPAVVLHAAAHKHVPMMEANPGEAIKNNVLGTKKLVDEAIRAGVEAFVMISTDKAVNPTSVMGACKRLAERYVQSRSGVSPTRLATVRFGNVLGSNGSVVPLFKEQIRRGGPVTVTHPDMTRYFMTIPEASQLVLQAGAQGNGGEIFVLDMGEPVKVVDLARDLIRLSGLDEEDIEIAFSGLRPGEKLYEELYDTGEERTSTPHAKIFAAKHRPVDPARFLSQLEQLTHVVDEAPAQVIAALKKMIPEYDTALAEDETPPRDFDRPSELPRTGLPGESHVLAGTYSSSLELGLKS